MVARATIELHFEADKSILRFRNARDASVTSTAEQLLWIAQLYATRSHRVSRLCKRCITSRSPQCTNDKRFTR